MLAAALAMSTAAYAQNGEGVSERIRTLLLSVQEMMDANHYQEATERLQGLLARKSLNNYERAVVLQNLGYAHASSEDYTGAVRAFEQSLALNAFGDAAARNLRYNLAQLYLTTEEYAKGVELLSAWMAKAEQIRPDTYTLLANGYYALKQYQRVLETLRDATARIEQPEKAWYSLQLAAYYELQRYAEAARLLEKAVEKFPDEKDFWRQLAAIYQQLEQYDEAVSTLVLAHDMGLLDGADMVRLARLYRFIGAPQRAAAVLVEEMKNGSVETNLENETLLAESWQQARELKKAAQTFARAASLGANGELFIRQGKVLMEMDDWPSAVSAFQQGIVKGDVKDLADAYFLLGVARYEMGAYDDAKKTFTHALRFPTVKDRSGQWLKQVETVLARGG